MRAAFDTSWELGPGSKISSGPSGPSASSAGRVERRTVPAEDPSSTEIRTDVPSARPTSSPDLSVEALAAACVRYQRPTDTLMMALVPVRTDLRAPLDVRSAFLLNHVDSESTVADIASSAQLPLDEVLATFFELLALGLVEMTGRGRGERPPSSGVFYSEPSLSKTG